MSIEFRLFLPQMRLTYRALAERARAAERAGFGGLALMDHLMPPLAEEQPMFEAIVTAAWIAATTERLGVGHLVLCDSLHHPAVLARQAVSIDHASGGRFELGIGWGSVPAELDTFGVASSAASDRFERLTETLEVLRALWTGERVDYHGRFYRISGGVQQPPPLRTIPIVIGGAGPRTMRLVAEHAAWWNLPMHQLERLEELRPLAGSARVSAHLRVTFVASESTRSEVVALAERRFGRGNRSGWVSGNGDELVEALGRLADRGVERVYLWFTDFAPVETLEAFGAQVIAPLGQAQIG